MDKFKKKTYLIILSIFTTMFLLFSGNAFAQTYAESQNLAFKNLIENSGAESGNSKWKITASTGSNVSWVPTTASSTVITGKTSFRIARSGGGSGSLTVCTDYINPKGLKNNNGEIGISHNFSTIDASGTARYYVEDVSGTVVTSLNLEKTTVVGEVLHTSKLFAFNDKDVRACVEASSTLVWGFTYDNIWMGSPRSVVKGPVITDWENYTPTFTSFGSVTNINFAYKQVGDSIFIRGYFTTGTAAAAVASISLPKSFVAQATGGIILAGSVEGSFNHGTQINAIYSNNDTALYFSCSDGTAHGLAKQNASLCFASNNNVSFTIGPIKIQGLSGTATAFTGMCKDAYECTNTFHANVSTVAGGNVITSDVAGWITSITGTSSDRLITFKSGLVTVKPHVEIDCTSTGAGINTADFWGVTSSSVHVRCVNSSNTLADAELVITLNKMGVDYVDKKVIQGYLSEQRIAVSYYASSNKSASTTQQIDFDTKELDATNCNCVTTGSGWKFTAPKSSVYSVSISQVYSTTTGSSYITIYKNNTAYKNFSFTDGSVSTADSTTLIKLDAGDYIDIRPNVSKTFFGNALNAISTMRAMISITEVSN